jgi:hypothetical protein
MNCPSCAYQSPYAAMRCPQCRQVFDTEAVETLGHLVYLRERLENWRAEGRLHPGDAAEMLSLAEQEIKTLATRLALAPLDVTVTTGAPAEVAAASAASAVTVAAPAESVPSPAVPSGRRASERLSEPHVHESAHVHDEPLVGAPNGAAAGHLTGLDEPDLASLNADQESALAAASHGAGASTADAGDYSARHADTQSAPAGPAFEWRNVGTYLLSERTLHGLLGLGAFLILASGVVISTLNPTGLGPFQHLAAVVATTLLFFAAGYVVRQRLHLTIAGATLLGIAGAFVPLTIWTLGQRQILDWETGAIWLVSSLVSLPLYLGAQRLLRDRTFALLAALAGGSELLAALNWLGVPLEWALTALVVLTTAYVRIAWRLGDGTTGMAWALSWTGRLANPLVLLALLVGKLGSDTWLMTFGRPLGLGSDDAIVLGWWLGWLFYVQNVRLHHRRRDLYAAVWLLPVAYLLTLARLPIEAAWHNVGLAVLALAYLGWGYRRLALANRAAEASGTTPVTQPTTYALLARDPLFQVAGLLTVVSAFWLRPTQLSQTVTFALLALFFVAATVLLRLRLPAWIGMFWLILAFTQGINDWVTVREYPLAFAILTFALLAAAEIVVRRTGEGDRPLLATIFGLRRGGPTWRSLLGAPLFTTGYLVGLIALLLALERYWWAPVAIGARRLGTAEILGFAVLLGIFAASSVARRTGFFLYFVAWIALIPIGATAVNIRDWLGRLPHDADTGLLLATVSFVYLLIAWLADRALVTAGGGPLRATALPGGLPPAGPGHVDLAAGQAGRAPGGRLQHGAVRRVGWARARRAAPILGGAGPAGVRLGLVDLRAGGPDVLALPGRLAAAGLGDDPDQRLGALNRLVRGRVVRLRAGLPGCWALGRAGQAGVPLAILPGRVRPLDHRAAGRPDRHDGPPDRARALGGALRGLGDRGPAQRLALSGRRAAAGRALAGARLAGPVRPLVRAGPGGVGAGVRRARAGAPAARTTDRPPI